MSVAHLQSERLTRSRRMLTTALGTDITAWLDEAAVVEVMLNPDGHLWVDRLGSGLADTGERLSAADGERIVRLVAHHVGAEVHAAAPRVSAELPGTGLSVLLQANTLKRALQPYCLGGPWGRLLDGDHERLGIARVADAVWLLDGQGGLAVGEPQELIDDGHVGRAFDSDAVRFSPALGRFELVR